MQKACFIITILIIIINFHFFFHFHFYDRLNTQGFITNKLLTMPLLGDSCVRVCAM